MERKTRSFLISTIDDSHVLLVEGCTSAYAIYLKLRDRYESSTAHGDPYYINHYLMTIKYDEGTDLMEFCLEFERALKHASESTGIVVVDEQKSLYLYYTMPSSWRPDLAIWKESKTFILYTDLKANIERNVLGDYAKRKYVIAKGSPESAATASETALQVISNAPHDRDPPRRAQGCTYRHHSNHAILEYRVLQKHLRTRSVKEGTVLRTNFAIIDRKPRDDQNPFPAKQQRTQRSGDRQRTSQRKDNEHQAPDIYDRFGNPVSSKTSSATTTRVNVKPVSFPALPSSCPTSVCLLPALTHMLQRGLLTRDTPAMRHTRSTGSRRSGPMLVLSWLAASSTFPSSALVMWLSK
ncbi:hypothetical protein PI124_g20793 [Phytophthora idaei]|nr:hypothetical protein PI125_g22264 [Phytophthora idaei]KAG3128192.1 hypothetical protein PI126_g21505 [Phytophthora idaei]KAG3234151.1 hypothetical protein PI124_g20793 [Phytophthora idaei]